MRFTRWMYIVVMGCSVINTASAETPSSDANIFDITPSFGIEYRTQFVGMRPLSLNDLTAEKVTYFDQRARLTLYSKLVRTFGYDPHSTCRWGIIWR